MPTYILLQNAKNDRNQSNSNPKVIHSPLKTQNSKLKTQNSKLKTQNSKLKTCSTQSMRKKAVSPYPPFHWAPSRPAPTARLLAWAHSPGAVVQSFLHTASAAPYDLAWCQGYPITFDLVRSENNSDNLLFSRGIIILTEPNPS